MADIIARIAQNKERFQGFNALKLRKFLASLSSKNLSDLIDIIPVLITGNHPQLPGFVPEYDPVGIYGYRPAPRAINLLASLFPGAGLGDARPRRQLIEFFAIIGSTGSIAYTEDSDIDFWICLDESALEKRELDAMRSKLRLIEHWITENYNIETHFYVNDTENVKVDIFDADEVDITGKALGKLLKDELYRSSILLNGKIPFWWVVPAGTDDARYAAAMRAVPKEEFAREYIDLGNLHVINADDFIGAGLFQILKSLGNPFKSIIKIGLIEKYLLDAAGERDFLCTIVKRNVHEGKLETEQVDPYILMFRLVYDYFARNIMREDPTADEILKTCFYLKVEPNLSQYVTLQQGQMVRTVTAGGGKVALQRGSSIDEKIAIMNAMVKEWRWDEDRLREIDNFRGWDITAVNTFWNDITKLVLKSYKRITASVGRASIAQKFTDAEIKFFARKIQSSLAPSANKIRPAVIFKDNPIEKQLTVESVSEAGGRIAWLLTKGFIGYNVSSTMLIMHKEPSLIGMLAWISINRLYLKDTTRLEIKSRYQLVENNFLRELLNDLTLHFSIKKLHIRNRYFLVDPFPILNFIIFNLDSKYTRGFEEFYYLYHNSWGETVFERFTREIDLAAVLERILNGALAHKESFDASVWLTSSYPYKSGGAFKAYQSLFRTVYGVFLAEGERSGRKFLTMLGNNFVLYSCRRHQGGDAVECRVFDTEVKMLYSLINLSGMNATLTVDERNPELNYLRAIVERRASGAINIFFQRERKYCYFFIIDECGSLSFYRKGADRFQLYLARLHAFADNAAAHVVSHNPHSPLATVEKRVRLYELTRGARNAATVTEVGPEVYDAVAGAARGVVPLRLSLSLLDNGETGYRFTLPDGGLSDTYGRADIPSVAREIAVLMDTVPGYGYYATDITIENIGVAMYRMFTSFSFAEKNRFELLVEKGLGG